MLFHFSLFHLKTRDIITSVTCLSLLFFTVASYLYNMGSNDGYDFDTGADENKKESVVNLVGR